MAFQMQRITWPLSKPDAHTERAVDREVVHQQQREATAGIYGVESAPKAPPGDVVLETHYASDRVIATLEIDLPARIWGYQKSFLGSPACWAPPVNVLVNLFCCPTLYLCTCFRASEAKVAAAHRLTLRERTLLLEVDEHLGSSNLNLTYIRGMSNRGDSMPSCCEVSGALVARVPTYKRVIRLAEIDEIAVAPGVPCCSCPSSGMRGPDQLVVTNQWKAAVAAIAGPKDAEAFITKVLEQKQKVLAQGLDTDAPQASVAPPGGRMLQQLMGMMGDMVPGGIMGAPQAHGLDGMAHGGIMGAPQMGGQMGGMMHRGMMGALQPQAMAMMNGGVMNGGVMWPGGGMPQGGVNADLARALQAQAMAMGGATVANGAAA